MKKHIFLLIIFLSLLAFWHHGFLHPSYPSSRPIPADTAPPPADRILLVPLDGRPPCRQFVINAGRIANCDVIVPPSELQDYYSQPGDTKGLQDWLRQEIRGSHAVILSIDQMLFGGLLAAREKEVSPEDIRGLLSFLRELHAEHPHIPIYAFSILPRLTPQDTIDGYEERRDLIAYSRLVGRQAAGLSVDAEEIEILAARIPPKSMQKYLSHFSDNEKLNEQLSLLAADGVFRRLILGQDDGEEYSIPNIEKQHLRSFLQKHGISEQQVFLAHGADEIALTLLAEIKCRETGFIPRIHVEYNDSKTAGDIMPYMAIPTGAMVEEKLRMLGADTADTPDTADFTLFVSTMDYRQDTLKSRERSVQRLTALANAHAPTAIVDLSRHFTSDETLLPLLLREDVPLNAFIAYAGWNTASNSIGTALAQAILFSASKEQAKTKEALLATCRQNLMFLHNRYLEDSFYLKDIIDKINASLKKEGYINTADLDLEHNYQWATAMLQDAMKQKLAAYKESKAFRTPFVVQAPAGSVKLRVRDIRIDTGFPWPRTFEIDLQSTITLELLDE